MERKLTKPRILVVDDEKDLLLLMETTLGREGYDVEVCLNADNLIARIKLHPPDIVLLDIRMQGINGGEICKKLKRDEETSKIAVILFSANHDIEKITRECGADDCLMKPFNMAMAREKFGQVLTKSRFDSSNR